MVDDNIINNMFIDEEQREEKITSCKECPYKNRIYSFELSLWTLKCNKTNKKISSSKYTEEDLVYEIPKECPLEDI